MIKAAKEQTWATNKEKTQIGKIYKKFNKRINNWKPNTNKDIGESAGNQRLE